MGQLDVQGLHTYYGLAHILQGVSLTCNEGEAIALLGRNGQGKTTTIKSIMSLVVPKRGKISFQGADVTGLPTHSISRKGLSIVPEGRHIFPALSVLDHLRVPIVSQRANRAERIQFAFELFPELRAKRHVNARELSGGQQQMLVIARALMTDPRLLLLDEPMEGLSPKVVSRVIDALKAVRKLGVTIFLASTSCELAFRIADRAYIIEKGRIVHHAERHDLLADRAAQERFLGVKGA